MKTIRKWIASLLVLTLCASMLAVAAGAYTRVDTNKPVSLQLSYGVPGMTVRLYLVALMSETVRFSAYSDPGFVTEIDPNTGDEVRYGSDFLLSGTDLSHDGLADNTDQEWIALASTLSAYVASRATSSHPINALYTQTTDDQGNVSFSGLVPGIYLVDGDSLVVGYTTYHPTPTLITVPNLSSTDEWVYDVVAEGKLSTQYDPPTPPPPGDTTVSRNVMKVWEDSENEEERPQSVTVLLMQNGQEYSRVTLSEANNWQHTWTGLSPTAYWQLVEVDVPEEYTMLVSQTGNTYVVTNTYISTIPEDDIPMGTPPVEEIPEEVEDIPEEEPPQALPQTGILWWPVQLLTVVGILLFSLGWLEIRRSKKRDET